MAVQKAVPIKPSAFVTTKSVTYNVKRDTANAHTYIREECRLKVHNQIVRMNLYQDMHIILKKLVFGCNTFSTLRKYIECKTLNYDVIYSISYVLI